MILRASVGLPSEFVDVKHHMELHKKIDGIANCFRNGV